MNKEKRKDNTSGYKGVHWHKAAKKYEAYVTKANGKKKYLGLYTSAKEAALAYNKAALKYQGEFAHQNKI